MCACARMQARITYLKLQYRWAHTHATPGIPASMAELETPHQGGWSPRLVAKAPHLHETLHCQSMELIGRNSIGGRALRVTF